MRPRWRLILRIRLAKATDPAHGVQTLLERCEPAICTAATVPATTIIGAPRIVLGLGACSNTDDTDANSQHEQQEPHSGLLGWPLSYKRLPLVFYSMLTRDEAFRIAANIAKLLSFCASRSEAHTSPRKLLVLPYRCHISLTICVEHSPPGLGAING